ncbi:katanin p60 ATPase-containing subunit A-like 2 [Corticium candelabrum]|uniref:katanin p60 ATPase-containing subunit A-like 2 n=1 Tax=Corticium candelabrum TaxID=121492 RepID=UPI002E25539E|nr:katanin p60 ATPase-containing subunit A-like 2 [Corticium candelabrum]
MSEEDGGTKGGLPPRPRRNDTKQGSNPLLPKIPNPPVAHRRLSVGSSCSTTSSGPSLSGHVKKKASSAGKVQEKRKETDCFDNKPVDLSSLNLAGTSIRQITTPINASSKGMVVNMREMLNSAVLGETQKALGDGRLMKPIAAFAGDDVETRELAAVISRDIYLENPDVRWNDIIGLGEAKRLVKEAVVYPIKVCIMVSLQ